MYWEERCLGEEAVMAQMDEIIKNLQDPYNELKNKYANMVVLTNFTLQDFLEKLKEALEEVFNFVKFCKKTTVKLITDIEALRRSQGVTFRVDL